MKFSEYNDNDLNRNSDTYNWDHGIDANKINETIDQYSKLSDDQLMNEFFKKSVDLKQTGLLNKTKLDLIKQTLAPYLNEQQIDNLNKILDLVNNV